MEVTNYPPVSVIVLTYNSERFIEETLLSVVSQEYPDIQIVVGDDCSKDTTVELVNRIAARKDSNFRLLFSDVNKGISENFNACLRACSGEYIFLLGGDDLFMPGKIREQVQFMEAHPDYAISYHDVSVFDSDSGLELYKFNESKHGFHEGLADCLVRQGTFNCGCATAVRNIDLPFCEQRIKYASDWLWYIEILAKTGKKIGYIDGVYSKYRRHSENITTRSPVTVQLKETLLTLEICSEKFDFLKPTVKVAMSERLFVFSVKALLAKELLLAVKCLLSALFVDFRAPLYALSRRILKRV